MATEKTEKTTPRRKAATKSAVAEEEAKLEAERLAAEEAAKGEESTDVSDEPEEVDGEPVTEDEDEEDPLDVLEPLAETKTWIIGKPPEDGGTPDEYSRYEQRPLPYVTRMRFFAYVSTTIAEAIKAGGSVRVDGADLLGGDGSIREKAAALTESDFGDVASFMALAFQLGGYVDDFLLECFCFWLDVPTGEKVWAKRIMSMRYDPENDEYGITDDMAEEMIAYFIDQNYADIRRFFVERLPRLLNRARAQERRISKSKAKKTKSVGRASTSAQ